MDKKDNNEIYYNNFVETSFQQYKITWYEKIYALLLPPLDILETNSALEY